MKNYVLALVLALSCAGWLRADAALEPEALPPPAPSDLPITNGAEIIQTFRARYEKANKPRLLLYINRDLVRDRGEMVEVARLSQNTQVKGDVVDNGSGTNVQIGNNTGSNASNSGIKASPVVTGQGGEKKEDVGLALRVDTANAKGVQATTDYQAREIEETFGEAFFQAGAHLVDQKVAATLLKTFATAGDRFLTASAPDAEKEQVQSLLKSADIVVEILARQKMVRIVTPAGDEFEPRLDLVATAMDLRQPGLVLARVSSDSLFGFNQRDGKARQRQARKVTSAEITQQVSLALMDRLSF